MNDPYLSKYNATVRLKDEYKKYGKIIVALDYDDTIFDFHKKGHTYEAVITLIKRCNKLGFYVVIFTGSEKEKYDSIREHCARIGIEITGINENAFPMNVGNNGKIYYNVLLDDRAGLDSAFAALLDTVTFAEMMTKPVVGV